MNKTTVLLGSALLVGLVACNSSKFEGYTKTENGLHYKFMTHDEAGVKPVEGDAVAFKYIFRLKSNDSVLVNSSLVSQDGTGITQFILPKPTFVGSLEDAMMMMAKNDSASFIVSADSFYLKTTPGKVLPPFIKPGDFIQVDIKMVDIKTKAELAENQKKQQVEMEKMAGMEKGILDKYLADNKITTAPTASGLIFIETAKGKGGAHPTATDEVTVHYKGTLLDGTKFDSSYDRNEPAKFPLNRVIPGWTEGIQLMTKGSKAKLIIPSMIGYGAQGAGQQIPPFSSLIFEVELIDFQAGPPAEEMQMPH
jgi:FKBP-type peptidyl-prolyl cis-trans isomerase FkpA